MIETTIKQRKEAYLKVAQGMDKHVGSQFLCDQLRGILDSNKKYEVSDVLIYCPEIALFEPKRHGLEWWDLDDAQSRVICMLLCYEMCKR